ncbi:hypothetical protein M23134_05013 [Microscilla marina ATCC 23134]|uniref:Uncharacterized protein n=1 Tax=Microscilla marina ATCC 23134 TaxID=313606 RepID=A1ZCW8_MICM2|nr:hypothetical protein M23134_05013 [Microscilla marina ATCC 23134]
MPKHPIKQFLNSSMTDNRASGELNKVNQQTTLTKITAEY